MTVMKKESWTRDEMEQLRNELEQERDARLKLKGAQFEKTSELDEALRTVQKLKVERDDADRAKVAAEAKASLIDDAFRARDDAMSTAMSAKMAMRHMGSWRALAIATSADLSCHAMCRRRCRLVPLTDGYGGGGSDGARTTTMTAIMATTTTTRTSRRGQT